MGIDLGSLSLESKTPNYMLVLSACDRQKRRSVALPQKKSEGLILGTLFAITVFRRPNRVDGYHISLLSENGTLSFLIIASAPNVKLQKCGGNLTTGTSHAVGRGSGSSVLGPYDENCKAQDLDTGHVENKGDALKVPLSMKRTNRPVMVWWRSVISIR